MFTRLTAVSVPRSYRIHWPSPDADQRVARLLSSVFCGTLPSSPLATTDATGTALSGTAAVPYTATSVLRLRWLGCVVPLQRPVRTERTERPGTSGESAR